MHTRLQPDAVKYKEVLTLTAFSQILFHNGHATPLMLGQWRQKGAGKPLSPALTLTVKGEATAQFRALWREAFPARDPLPQGALHLADGTPSVSFFKVWRK